MTPFAFTSRVTLPGHGEQVVYVEAEYDLLTRRDLSWHVLSAIAEDIGLTLDPAELNQDQAALDQMQDDAHVAASEAAL